MTTDPILLKALAAAARSFADSIDGTMPLMRVPVPANATREEVKAVVAQALTTPALKAKAEPKPAPVAKVEPPAPAPEPEPEPAVDFDEAPAITLESIKAKFKRLVQYADKTADLGADKRKAFQDTIGNYLKGYPVSPEGGAVTVSEKDSFAPEDKATRCSSQPISLGTLKPECYEEFNALLDEQSKSI